MSPYTKSLIDKCPAIITDFMVIERNPTYLLIVDDFYSLELLNHSITAWENEGNVYVRFWFCSSPSRYLPVFTKQPWNKEKIKILVAGNQSKETSFILKSTKCWGKKDYLCIFLKFSPSIYVSTWNPAFWAPRTSSLTSSPIIQTSEKCKKVYLFLFHVILLRITVKCLHNLAKQV